MDASSESSLYSCAYTKWLKCREYRNVHSHNCSMVYLRGNWGAITHHFISKTIWCSLRLSTYIWHGSFSAQYDNHPFRVWKVRPFLFSCVIEFRTKCMYHMTCTSYWQRLVNTVWGSCPVTAVLMVGTFRGRYLCETTNPPTIKKLSGCLSPELFQAKFLKRL